MFVLFWNSHWVPQKINMKDLVISFLQFVCRTPVNWRFNFLFNDFLRPVKIIVLLSIHHSWCCEVFLFVSFFGVLLRVNGDFKGSFDGKKSYLVECLPSFVIGKQKMMTYIGLPLSLRTAYFLRNVEICFAAYVFFVLVFLCVSAENSWFLGAS